MSGFLINQDHPQTSLHIGLWLTFDVFLVVHNELFDSTVLGNQQPIYLRKIQRQLQNHS